MTNSPIGWTPNRFLLGVTIIVLLTILASPAAADPAIPGGTFTDDDGNVHEGYIEAIASAGVTRGCNPPSNYYYCPGDAVTRGQMAAFLTRALNLSGAMGDAFFDDDDSVFESDINALAAAGITRGCNPPDNSRFCPDQPVTRGQMAAFLVRAFHFTAGAGTNNFEDDDGSIFQGDIDRLAAAGVTRGCDPPSNRRYCPEAPVLRDQMATFLARSLDLDPIIHPPAGNRQVIASDTLIEGERLVLGRGDSLEFRNGARLMIGEGASVDWQGTPTDTWTDDGLIQNLRRDVRIFGQGDIMFMAGSRPSTIRFVEIDLQPIEELGHYPLHWHFAGEGARGTLVEGVVVKNSTNRAFVPHASHGITFRDTIAKNIAGEAYWWDGPPSPDRTDPVNNSNDILYDHALADGVTNAIGDNRGFRLSAFKLQAGSGNAVVDSVALNIHPTHRKSCSGFAWFALGNQPSVWRFERNKTFGSDCHGIFVWQNDGQHHVIDGFTSTEGIEHGAYKNKWEYRNVNVPYAIVHAIGWSVTSSNVGEVITKKHQFEGTVTFSETTVESLKIHNTQNHGEDPGHYVFDNTGLECSDVQWASWVADTTVTIDGAPCPTPLRP